MLAILGLIRKRDFWPLLGSLSFGALNDNFFRQSLIVLMAFGAFGLSREQQSAYAAVASGLLILPFFLFSGLAGAICDSFRKSTIVKYTKAAEFILMLMSAALFFHGHIFGLLGMLFLMGTQSAFFGPVKYSLLPEILGERGLVLGNGVVEGATFVTIVLGTILGSWLVGFASGTILVPLGMVLFSGAGLLFALAQPKSAMVRAFVPIPFNPWLSTREILRIARKKADVWLGILAISWFWMMGSILLSQMPVISSSLVGAQPAVNTFLVSTFAVGIALGSLLAQLITKGEVSAKLVPATSALTSLFLLCFALSVIFLPAPPRGPLALGAFLGDWRYLRLAVSAFLLSVAAGLFVVPLNALVQHRSEKAERARVIAALNVVNSFFMVLGAVLVLLLTALGMSLGAILVLLAASALLVTLLTFYLLPDETLRQVARMLLFLLYRPKIKGIPNIDSLEGGPAIVIPNHTSFLDVALLVCYIPRKLSFAIDQDWAKAWWVRPFLRFFEAVPVKFSQPVSIRTLVSALEAGKLLVIFPEGRITTTGNLMKIFDGPAMVAFHAKVPLVPVVIDGAEYSFFGRLRKTLRNMPKSFKVAMTVFPPEPLRSVRGEGEPRREFRRRASQEIYAIMVQARFKTRDCRRNLFTELLAKSKAYGRGRVILRDVLGAPVSYRGLIARARFLGRAFSKASGPGERVGVLLPNSSMLCATLFGLWAAGRIPVMLNHSQGPASLAAALAAAEVKTVVSSSGFLKKAGLEALAGSLDATILPLEGLDVSLPARLLGLFYRGKPADPSDTAAVVFTSGSEGKPKGVCLSHENLLSNMHQAKCVFEINEDDCLFNAMPAFHAFGLNIGMLLPPLLGLRSYSYVSPLHVKAVPELIYESGATVVLASDTFASAWGMNANPYDFHTVRFMVLGAEKVKPKTMDLFFHKLGVRLFEGYGVTEASPVVAVGSRLRVRDGSVGTILPGIEHRLEKVEGIATGGRLLLKGPNIMLGYMRPERPGVIEPPEGGWYDTGDIAEIDEDGFLWIRGRFKRFSKISGEMVSLAAVEDALGRRFPGVPLAVLSLPSEDRGEQLCLVSSGKPFDQGEVRDAVKDAGLTDLSVPRRFLEVDEIPLSPLGKADLPKLQEMVEKALSQKGEA
jgi:acyl-[acyl-carrier-protein]-phospholipid O-acyltransferase/long-chain-fatty-acid--[acyl-carrier-protein] ligase